MTARIRSRPGKRCQAQYSSDFIAFRLLNRVIVLSTRESYHIPQSTGSYSLAMALATIRTLAERPQRDRQIPCLLMHRRPLGRNIHVRALVA